MLQAGHTGPSALSDKAGQPQPPVLDVARRREPGARHSPSGRALPARRPVGGGSRHTDRHARSFRGIRSRRMARSRALTFQPCGKAVTAKAGPGAGLPRSVIARQDERQLYGSLCVSLLVGSDRPCSTEVAFRLPHWSPHAQDRWPRLRPASRDLACWVSHTARQKPAGIPCVAVPPMSRRNVQVDRPAPMSGRSCSSLCAVRNAGQPRGPHLAGAPARVRSGN